VRHGSYRSTSLNQASKHCPRALDFFDEGAPYDRDIFTVGIAAHHVLQAIGERTNAAGGLLSEEEMDSVASTVCEKLIEKGREFEGSPEPPLPADPVWEGRNLALEYLVPRPFYPGGRFEYGLAVDAHFNPCAYGPRARARGILDFFKIYDTSDGEEAGSTVAIHRDYKSDWRANRARLDSLQLRLQTVLVWKHHGDDVDVIRREVVNLRNGQIYWEELWLDDEETQRRLKEWQDDLSKTMLAYDRMRKAETVGDAVGVMRRPAVPGIGCYGCPYLAICDDGQGMVTGRGFADTPEDRARAFVVSSGLASALKSQLANEAAEAPIVLADGKVGFLAREKSVIVSGACQQLMEEWEFRQGDGRWVELLEALGLGKTHFENAAKAMGMVGRGGGALQRREFIEEVTEQETVSQFCWEKSEEGDDDS
jgi:hypothetical protein